MVATADKDGQESERSRDKVIGGSENNQIKEEIP